MTNRIILQLIDWLKNVFKSLVKQEKPPASNASHKEKVPTDQTISDISSNNVIISKPNDNLEQEKTDTADKGDNSQSVKDVGNQQKSQNGETENVYYRKDNAQVKNINKEINPEDIIEPSDKSDKTPYKKDKPTKEKNTNRDTSRADKNIGTEKEINLGNKQTWHGIKTKHQSPVTDEKEKDKQSEEKDENIYLKYPHIELNLDDAEIYLVLPKQELVKNIDDKKIVEYKVRLNDIENNYNARIKTNRKQRIFIEELRIKIEKSLLKFNIELPPELAKKFILEQIDNSLYVFVPKANNFAKMYELFNDKGEVNPLPRRDVWLLLNESFELLTDYNSIDERWLWDKYQLYHAELEDVDNVKIRNKATNEIKIFATQPIFSIESEKLVLDDFKKESPLYTGSNIFLKAPRVNNEGWNVWIQNESGYKLKKNWTGDDLLEINTKEDLPNEYGEFQIDICKKNTRKPEGVIFFRYIPYLEINYPKELILPDEKIGHKVENIDIKFKTDSEWELKNQNNNLLERVTSNHYIISLPSDHDSIRFSIQKQNNDENIINCQVTIPRLKWRTSKHKNWAGSLLKITRDDLAFGDQYYIYIKTNDIANIYNVTGLIEAESETLQEGQFKRIGAEYIMELNQFFDTIKSSSQRIMFRAKITNKGNSLFEKHVGLIFFEEVKCKKVIAFVKSSGKKKKGKGFSKKEILNAGLQTNYVHKLHLPYDKRRKSFYKWNVDELKIVKK